MHIHRHYATATIIPTKRTHHLNVRRWRSIEWQRRRLRPKLAHEDNNVRPAHAQQTTLVYLPKYTYVPHAWPRQSMTGPRSHIARQAAANLVFVNFGDTSIVLNMAYLETIRIMWAFQCAHTESVVNSKRQSDRDSSYSLSIFDEHVYLPISQPPC
jgi:hypothetical protein